ncbi:MAG: hypothetical protein RLZZ426_249 [Actinomycetota bacterium]|jgi:hypothetical protein
MHFHLLALQVINLLQVSLSLTMNPASLLATTVVTSLRVILAEDNRDQTLKRYDSSTLTKEAHSTAITLDAR